MALGATLHVYDVREEFLFDRRLVSGGFALVLRVGAPTRIRARDRHRLVELAERAERHGRAARGGAGQEHRRFIPRAGRGFTYSFGWMHSVLKTWIQAGAAMER
jgi:hypothetical protein